MFSEEIFLKKAGFFNPKMKEIDNSPIGSKDYFGDLGIDPSIVALTFIQLTYRNPETMSSKTIKIAKEIKEALDYLQQHKTEALLSSQPIVRAFAEILFRLS